AARLHLHSFPTRLSSDLISARGVAVSTFDSPLTETLPSIEQQFDILSQQVEAKRTPVPQGKALAEDIVLTPRFADVLGITQWSLDRKSTRLNSSHVKISY